MDSLANYGSDGDNSNNSDDTKMPCSRGSESIERRASDANYDPVQMDMSEESNNNNSSGDSGSERAPSPVNDRHRSNRSRRESSRHRSSPTDQRRSDHENHHSSNSRDDNKHRGDRNERGDRRRRRDRSRESGSNKSARSSHDVDRRQRRTDHSRDSRDAKRSRDEERKSSRDDERRRERKSASSCRDERNDERQKDHHHYRDEKRDRSDRDRSEKDHHRRDRERRGSRDERTKERNREERTSREEKEKARTRSRSRSKERPSTLPFRAMSYREEKGRSKLAQLEKLGIELKAPAGEPIIPVVIGEPNYYNPLATATQGKYAEQIQKRKLLWANKSKQEEGKTSVATASTANTWMGTTFTHDQDGKVTAKFKRLMGIKDDMPSTPQPGPKPDILKKQEEMFNNMEQQYEVARATTHTQRGVGLGYATGGYQFPR